MYAPPLKTKGIATTSDEAATSLAVPAMWRSNLALEHEQVFVRPVDKSNRAT